MEKVVSTIDKITTVLSHTFVANTIAAAVVIGGICAGIEYGKDEFYAQMDRVHNLTQSEAHNIKAGPLRCSPIYGFTCEPQDQFHDSVRKNWIAKTTLYGGFGGILGCFLGSYILSTARKEEEEQEFTLSPLTVQTGGIEEVVNPSDIPQTKIPRVSIYTNSER